MKTDQAVIDKDAFLSDEIASHSSKETNLWIREQIRQINHDARFASNSLEFFYINSYFNSLFQLVLWVYPILSNKSQERIDKIVNQYLKLQIDLIIDIKQRNMYNLMIMLNLSRALNLQVASGLQKYRYFFRIQKREKGGFDVAKGGRELFDMLVGGKARKESLGEEDEFQEVTQIETRRENTE